METVESEVSQTTLSFESFSEKYRFYIPESHKSFFSSEDMERFLRARYNFFRYRDTDLKITAYNPDGDFLWLTNVSIMEIVMPDSPFIVATIIDYCNANDYKVQLIIHPVFNVQRRNGILVRQDFADEPGDRESYVYLEIGKQSKRDLARLQMNIEANLKELRRVVTDYDDMIHGMDRIAFDIPDHDEEVEWLKENFILLGMTELQDNKVAGNHLGVLVKSSVRQGLQRELEMALPFLPKEGITYRETEMRSNVNKNRQMYIVLLRDSGTTLVLVGHFRHRAEIELRFSVPTIRSMLEGMAKELKVPASSYMRKELYKAAQSLPIGFLLTRSREFLFPWFVKIISNMYTTEVSYEISIDETYNLVWAEVILPIAEAGRVPGRKLREFLKDRCIENLQTFRYEMSQIQILFMGYRSEAYSLGELHRLLSENAQELFATWASRFRELVYRHFSGEKYISAMLNRFTVGMSPDYEVHQEPDEVLQDLHRLERLTPEKGYQVSFYPQNNSGYDLIKVYSTRETDLSQLVPILTNFGFVINRQYAFPYSPDETTKYTYMFRVPANDELTTDDRKRIAIAIAGALNKTLTSRLVNALVLVAGLNERQLRLMKALCTYYYKISTAFSYTSLMSTVVKYPGFSRQLVNLFEAKFRPDGSDREVAKAKKAVEDSFKELDSALDEGLCRGLLSIVNAIVRTNYFLNRPEISFKIRSALIEDMPQPVPFCEIYIYAHDLEGIHLRGGPVARGGIRWSDRQDDYRTEILGLMKAQMVKNTVIVPVGSKGGFVLKGVLSTSKQSLFETGKQAYKRYIACLLELTDNLSATGNVIPAKNIKRLDGADPYLVVAADKGTATFSDLANEISIRQKFWLTDAFASGGSNGYDHKKQGITAKGAWEAVKRHCHEIDLNPEVDHITVVGIGDMGGDVFGNGMLLSESIKLVAAFNHLYIFIDPHPVPKTAFLERQRLFMQASNWDSYDTEMISKGGGVFPRSSRSIELSREAREILGIRAKTLSGEALIKAILRAPVDLLWNGGIGTYVKASKETHYQAGDPANDRVRIDAAQLRAKVIAEGGNLGLTQAARIEAAANGVRLNTDAIDNSGGVNMSDHEVNLKILLDILRRKKVIDLQKRHDIIKKYGPEEMTLVLQQNYSNNLGLSLDMRRVPRQFIYFRALIKFLNQKGLLNRELDNIPFEADLDDLEHGSRTLARPILCALAGFSKLYGSKLFLDSNDFKDQWFDRYILRYFPAGLAKKYDEYIKIHPLKREIVVTEILNEIVSFGGIVFFQRMVMATGRSPVKIAVAYARLSEFLNLKKMRNALGNGSEWLNADIHYEYLLQLEEKVYQITKRILKNMEWLESIQSRRHPVFASMLKEAARFSNFRLPRKIRILCNMFSEPETNRILDTFRQTHVLQDTFTIFLNNERSGMNWRVEDYFHTLHQYRIEEVRKILRDIRATSSWEVRFFTKIDSSIEMLVAKLLNLKGKGSDSKGHERKQRVRSMINDMVELNAHSELSIATFYEMLQFLNEEVLT